MNLRFLLLGAVISFLIVCNNAHANTDEKEASDFIKYVNGNLRKLRNEETLVKFQNKINRVKDLNKTKLAEQQIKEFIRSISTQLAELKKLDHENSKLKIQLSLVPDLGFDVLSEKDLQLMVAADSSGLVQSIKLCSYSDESRCNLTYTPDIENIFSTSTNAKEIEYYFLEWQRKSVPAMQNNSKILENLYRKTSQMLGYSKPSAFMLRDFRESSKFIVQNMDKVVLQLRPFYEQVHAYLRGKLRVKFGPEMNEYNKPMPEHLFDSLTTTDVLADNLHGPFNTNKTSTINDNLLKKGATAEKNFATAKKLYESMGMPQLEDSFWQDHSTDTTFFDMFKAIADIYYYRSIENLEPLYQKQPIPEFSSILGIFFKLAASSPKYLERLEIVDPNYSTYENRINRLYVQGLRDIFFIQSFYLFEHSTTQVIDENLDIDDICAYLHLKENLFGIQPPANSSKANYAIEFSSELTHYIYEIVLPYQLFEHFCTLTGEYVKDDPEKPLDLCDLSGHHEVGEKIYHAMSMGSTEELRKILKLLVNTEELNINGLLEYYRPLMKWFTEENKQKNNEVGWESSLKCE